MSAERRVLVLENLANLLDNYAYFLRDAGFEVYEAATLREANDHLDRLTFAACVVDLMLDDPVVHDTYEGTRLLDACEALAEGTQCLILSANPQPELAASLALRYKPVGYVNKAEVASGGARVLVGAVENACAVARETQKVVTKEIYPQLFGRGGEDSSIAEAKFVGELAPRGGAPVFERSAALVLRPLLPLFPTVRGGHAWRRVEGVGLQKAFWSKGLGEAITLTASRERDPSPVTDPLFQAETVGVRFVAERAADRDREEFTGRLPVSLQDPRAE